MITDLIFDLRVSSVPINNLLYNFSAWLPALQHYNSLLQHLNRNMQLLNCDVQLVDLDSTL